MWKDACVREFHAARGNPSARLRHVPVHAADGTPRFPRSAERKVYSAPLMPPSLRTRQKWTAISTATASGMATQCST